MLHKGGCMKFNYSLISIFIFFQSQSIASEVHWTSIAERSIDGGGRNIMRTAQGGIVAAFGNFDEKQKIIILYFRHR